MKRAASGDSRELLRGVPWPEGKPRRASMELAWLRGVEAVAVLALPRLLGESTIRVPVPRMKASVSSSKLSGRAGRGGGGPARFSKGTVLVFSGMGGLKSCAVS